MKKHKKRFLSLLLVAVFSVNALVPAMQADAAEIVPNPYPVYVNGTEVTFNNTINYQGSTYVKLHDVCTAAYMNVSFLEPGAYSWTMHNGPAYQGISIDVPTFVYIKKDVIHYGGPGYDKPINDGKPFAAVDITALYDRYKNTNDVIHDIGFDSGDLLIHKSDGTEERIELNSFYARDHMYMMVDDYKEKLHPYVVDMCMQDANPIAN